MLAIRLIDMKIHWPWIMMMIIILKNPKQKHNFPLEGATPFQTLNWRTLVAFRKNIPSPLGFSGSSTRYCQSLNIYTLTNSHMIMTFDIDISHARMNTWLWFATWLELWTGNAYCLVRCNIDALFETAPWLTYQQHGTCMILFRVSYRYYDLLVTWSRLFLLPNIQL